MQKLLKRAVCAALACAVLGAAAPARAARFSDVPGGCWAAPSIARAVETGLFKGETATRFGLGHGMSRGAFAVVLCRLFGWTAVSPAAGSYEDNRDPSAWYFSAVETARAHGALTGQSARFRPDDAVTREEMAVMLVRALGLGSIAGLDQGLAQPFSDVTANSGYIAMAARLGIVSGTSASAFSPERIATREQTAVMLMRVYDRLHAPAPEKLGAVPQGSGRPESCAAAAVGRARLWGGTSPRVTELPAAAELEAVRAAGARALVYVTGTDTALTGDPAAAAAAVAEAVDGADGVLLDIPAPARREALTALTTALRAALGKDRLLWVTAEVPSSGQAAAGDAGGWAALWASADRVILRPASYQKVSGGFPAAPQEPLEEVYYALASLPESAVREKLSLWISSGPSVWRNGRAANAIPVPELETLAAAPDADLFRSARYAACCLSVTRGGTQTVVWYHDGADAAARIRLAAFFGVTSVFYSDLRPEADCTASALLAAPTP